MIRNMHLQDDQEDIQQLVLIITFHYDMFYCKTYIAYVDKVQRFKNKYVQNGYRHFLGKVQVFYKNSQLRIARPELQYFLSQQLLNFSAQIEFYVR